MNRKELEAFAREGAKSIKPALPPWMNKILTAMTYNLMRVNLMRVFEEVSKTQKPSLTHPSDKKYTKILEKRQEKAKKNGGFVNPLFFQARIVRISSYTIRAVQNAIITGMSLASLMAALIARLAPG